MLRETSQNSQQKNFKTLVSLMESIKFKLVKKWIEPNAFIRVLLYLICVSILSLVFLLVNNISNHEIHRREDLSSPPQKKTRKTQKLYYHVELSREKVIKKVSCET